jgi:hypothetical protein
MIKSAAVLAVLAFPALASADDAPVTTQQAGTVVVVTPNAPVVVSGQAQPVQQPVQQQVMAPSMTPEIDPGAPPQPAPVVAAAPQNQPWSNVSHINGTVVPVGEQNNYLYQFKKTNISSNPIGWMFGVYGVSVSYAVSNNVAIRGDANFISMNGEKAYELGVSFPIYFRRTYSGPFLEPGVIVRGFEHDYSDYGADCYDCSSSSTDTFVGPEMMFGWQWMFDSGLNVAAAVGVARNLQNTSSDGYSSSDMDVQPAGYFRIGYAF